MTAKRYIKVTENNVLIMIMTLFGELIFKEGCNPLCILSRHLACCEQSAFASTEPHLYI